MSIEWIFFMSIFSIIFTVGTFKCNEKHKDSRSIFALSLFSVTWSSYVIFQCVSIMQLRYVPHAIPNKNMTTITDGLLDCVAMYYPLFDEQMSKVKTCIHKSKIFDVQKTRIPVFFKTVPVAFVLTKMYPDSIFTVNHYYEQMEDMSKALVLIHECTHLAISTVDHAYVWENNFDLLTVKQHSENADSYVDLIKKTCLNDIYVSYLS